MTMVIVANGLVLEGNGAHFDRSIALPDGLTNKLAGIVNCRVRLLVEQLYRYALIFGSQRGYILRLLAKSKERLSRLLWTQFLELDLL